ncbi:MAG: hypothetical protein COC01_01410 [Bacteroidetes bacterium]|nr:MAG: hypothetical protein COC01_01410 [Bacteroidota bacterium]
MTTLQSLEIFYAQNGYEKDGGAESKWFEVKFPIFTLKLPNPEWRRKIIYLHDIHHVINGCDTSWKGEAFIAGWEVANGFGRHFPISLLITWTMGYSMFINPKDVVEGYKKGVRDKGVIALGMQKNDLLSMEFAELKNRVESPSDSGMGFSGWLTFILWLIISQIVLLGPFILALLIIL